MKRINWKLVFSSIWLILTFSLVTWWFIFAMRTEDVDALTLQRHQRMILWEGGSLLFSVLVGGLFLNFFAYRDSRRHEKLQVFFANFSHDIKTSISRLRLQADILAENKLLENNKSLARLLKDLAKLDLQLENSLLITHMDETLLLNEKIELEPLIQSMQIEFEGLNIQCQGNAEIIGDSRAIRSVFRNILENSIRHGNATSVLVKAIHLSSDKVEIQIRDNGQGTQRDLRGLGLEILAIKQNEGTGIGLYLTKNLVEKMRGQIQFQNWTGEGFQAQLTLRGRTL